MTPAARVAAAADILDQWLDGAPVERVLTTWARGNRFAGSGDRAGIRDLVFDALRCCRSYAALGGAMTGRGLMIGRLRASGDDPSGIFTGAGYAPAPLSEEERDAAKPWDGVPEAERLDVPDWIVPQLRASLGANYADVMAALRVRAPVFLRVNLLKGDRAAAIAALADEGIDAQPHPLSQTALEVVGGARKIRNARAYRDGIVELQDAASQAVVDALTFPGPRVLDYCAGGGGKALAMAACLRGPVIAHDADPGRMVDLPQRAMRADAEVLTDTDPKGPFDLVLCDVPCSGSGAWRRQPEAKWRLTADRLDDLCRIQAEILDRAAGLVAPGGVLAYATCSLLDRENDGQIREFLSRAPGWRLLSQRRFTPKDGADGLFITQLTRE